jgi:KUP system potassium uptake protein
MPHPAPQTSGRLAVLAVAALGVVYGDIGTSPLYAIRESLGEHYGIEVVRDNVLGILSLVFWALITVVAVKYVTFVMRADNHGEGGILALTALLPAGAAGKKGNGRRALVLLGIFGTALLYGDGAITPAISVLSAVEGLEVATPVFEPYLLPIAVVILVALFAVQHHGTAGVGVVFGPVMIVWFAVIALLGLIHIVDHPSIFVAVDPRHAVDFFRLHPFKSFQALGSVFLVVTGGEALYADMGHFGARPIRLGWFGMVMPSLLLNYFGQGALLVSDPQAIDHPFYRLAPEWALIPLVVLATMATVIASQALISGAFSLTLQAVQLGYSPRLDIEHTSAETRGQVYLPAINWTLMLACIGLVVGFRSSSNLAAAYGLAVTGTMVVTTLIFFVVTREVWGWPRGRAMAVGGLFLVVDVAFFFANVLKIPAGGWFPLLAALLVFTLMTTWKTGRRLVYQRLRRGEAPIEAVIRSLTREQRPRVEGTAVYMFPEPGRTPPSFLANLRHNHVLHESVVFLSVQTAEVPRVLPSNRVRVYDHGEGFYQVVVRYGFMDEPDVPATLAGLISEIDFDPQRTTYFMGRETVRPTDLPGMRRWRERLFALLHRNATSAAGYLRLPPERVIEIGMPVEI